MFRGANETEEERIENDSKALASSCSGMVQVSPQEVPRKRSAPIVHPAGWIREIPARQLPAESTNKQLLVQALINDCSQSVQNTH
jgi:hypothetical protein